MSFWSQGSLLIHDFEAGSMKLGAREIEGLSNAFGGP